MIPKYLKPPKPEPVEYPEGRGKREVCTKTKAGKAEYLLRTFLMAKRQKGLRGICRKPLGEDVVFGHSRSRGFAGGFRDDRLEIDGKWNNAALHWNCNGRQQSTRYEWRNGIFQAVTQ